MRYAARIMSTVLGDDGGSRLYWEFLDSGLAESAGMGAYEYDDCGAIMTYICCAAQTSTRQSRAFANVASKKLLKRGSLQKELDLAKRKIASAIVLGSERTENRMFSVGSQWLVDQPFKTVAQIAATYESITLEQVNAAIAQFPLSPQHDRNRRPAEPNNSCRFSAGRFC